MGSLHGVQGRSTADRIRSKTFPMGLRGYDRAAVDAWLLEIAELVERLEEQPPPRDTAVRRALDEIGQETAAILQRAHAAAEEIEARSRAQADGRLQRAEREAEQTLAEAEERAARLEADTRRLWDERTRLLEEMRRLADEVLGVADDAIERLRPPPGREPEPEEPPPLEAVSEAPEDPALEAVSEIGEDPAPFEAVSELREELEAADSEQPTVEVEISRMSDEPGLPGEQPGSEPDGLPAESLPAAGDQPGSEPDEHGSTAGDQPGSEPDPGRAPA